MPPWKRSPSCSSLFGYDSEHEFEFEYSQLGHVAYQQDSGDELLLSLTNNTPISAPSSSKDSPPTPGVYWAKSGLHLYPKWTVQPTMAAITATLRAATSLGQIYEIRFIHEGAYSKLYEVFFDDKSYIMRVSLPVCPEIKTESEVATLRWVDQNTCLPVPRVVAYSSSPDNALGYEWILMTKIEGQPLSECFLSIPKGARERLVKQVAAFYATMLRHQPPFEGIGSIYKATSDSNGRTHVVGEMVSLAFF
jgi:hypothetical protein